ncbi:hypothetical protein JCM12296A_25530 [Desulfosarcina cetonica]
MGEFNDVVVPTLRDNLGQIDNVVIQIVFGLWIGFLATIHTFPPFAATGIPGKACWSHPAASIAGKAGCRCDANTVRRLRVSFSPTRVGADTPAEASCPETSA